GNDRFTGGRQIFRKHLHAQGGKGRFHQNNAAVGRITHIQNVRSRGGQGGCGRLRQNQRPAWQGLAAAGGGQQDKSGSNDGKLKMASPVQFFFRSPGSRILRI